LGPFLKERDLRGSRFPAEDRVTVRKAAELLDDLNVRAPVAPQGTATVGVARQSVEQSDRAALVAEILAVVKRHIEEQPPGRRNDLIETSFECSVGDGASRGVGRVGAWRAAKDVARDLVEQQHQGQRALGQSFPRSQFADGAGFEIGEKGIAQRGIKFGGALEPDLAVLFARRVAGRPEPGIEESLGPLGKTQGGITV
jgi:hypothetical protein